MSPNFLRTSHDAPLTNDHMSECSNHRRANLSMCSPVIGKSGWFSSYSTAKPIPCLRRILRVCKDRPRLASMMWVSCIANSSASTTRDEVRSETTSDWMLCKNWICVAVPGPLPKSSFRNDDIIYSRFISGVMVLSLKKTIPHLDTVAGVAKFRLSTSRMIRMLLGIPRRSPLGSVSILLSSKTELRFSAHSGSTSPSNTIQWRRSDSPFWLSKIFLKTLVNIPSVHSRVVPSRSP
mmetsp:Transcript_1997/g.5251  ORF Transcript_1997/g.5251 Transcript_1997/m.5251 type:complete len:236 (-) Transcript_1997:3534-4241(-)